jgi:hypothetical protein
MEQNVTLLRAAMNCHEIHHRGSVSDNDVLKWFTAQSTLASLETTVDRVELVIRIKVKLSLCLTD